MSDDTSRQFASGRTGVLGGSRLFHQLTDDRDRARPAPSLARLAWLEHPDLTRRVRPWAVWPQHAPNILLVKDLDDVVSMAAVRPDPSPPWLLDALKAKLTKHGWFSQEA